MKIYWLIDREADGGDEERPDRIHTSRRACEQARRNYYSNDIDMAWREADVEEYVPQLWREIRELEIELAGEKSRRKELECCLEDAERESEKLRAMPEYKDPS